MIKSLITVFATSLLLAAGSAQADLKADCEAKAVDKNGKPLAGAAKDAKIKKCLADGGAAAPANAGKADCEAKAVDKNGKKLAGAAKDAFIKKCEKDAAAPAGK